MGVKGYRVVGVKDSRCGGLGVGHLAVAGGLGMKVSG